MNPFRKYIDIIHEAEADVIDKPTTATPPQEKEKPADKPGGFNVMILNDGFTPAEVVLEAICSATGMSMDEAFNRMMRAHQGGWAPIKAYASKDMAETVAHNIMQHAQQNDRYDQYRQHPHFKNFKGPWPLTAEVVEAGG
jgi:ATP-dependent Clp protease adapter protein ClpS